MIPVDKIELKNFKLESGEELEQVTLAYETYGDLNRAKSNVVLVFHALSGDANVVEWWGNIVGSGKAFDTDKYFVLCINALGGCQGSTGPASIDPKTKTPYGLKFPQITIKDMVNAQVKVLDELKIDSVLVATGGSMGGMMSLQFAVSYPDRVRNVIPIATSARTSAQNIAFNEVGRRAIVHDPNWNKGDYYDKTPPNDGLSIARMVGHITYLSDKSMARKFGRKVREGKDFEVKFTGPQFEVESYLQYKGGRFTERFDANTYLYISKAIDLFDLSDEGNGSLAKALNKCKSRFLVIYFKSDWLFPEYQCLEIVDALKDNFKNVSYRVIESTYGHDAFLLETEGMTKAITSFLEGAK
ncbi:MAG: homoserine O-acetyltransferase [Candidatus Margulisiibacteriota bacterium]|nr:homoserine O-acetyltransferase [Candidatus Margulisiibacteriota bacterium]